MQRVIRKARSMGLTVKNIAVTICGATGLVIASASQAALPAAIGTGITALQEDVLDLVDLVWPFVLAVSFAVLLFKFYKRVISKA